MMRRLLAALAALLIVQAADARVLVVTPSRWPNADGAGYQNLVRAYTQTMTELGVEYDVMRADQVPTLQALTGAVKLMNGTTRSYVAVYHIAFYNQRAAGWPECNLDSLTRYGCWTAPQNASRVPQVFVGPVGNSGVNGIWSSVAGVDSTGVPGTFSATSFSTFPGLVTFANRSLYLCGTDYVWKETADYIQPLVTHWGSADPANGSTSAVLRTFVGIGISAASPGAGTGNSGPQACANCDSIGPRAALSDTMVFWARYRDPADKAPSFFVWPTDAATFGGGNYSESLVLMSLAAVDSITGNKVIGTVGGWAPQRLALYLGRGFSHSAGNATVSQSAAGGGVFIGDTTFTAGTVRDSLASLGVPITVGVNGDSVVNYPSEKSWYASPVFRFAPESYTGMWGADGNRGNALP